MLTVEAHDILTQNRQNPTPQLFAMKIEGKRGFLASLQAVLWVCGSLTSSDSHGRSAHLYVFAKYIQSVPYTGFSLQTRDSSRSQ